MAEISLDTDCYALLDVPISSTKDQIAKAYKKAALKWHPDKNRDNPKAADIFQQVQKAYELLTDEKARAAYDNLVKARIAKRERDGAMDAKRKKMRDDLEMKEKRFKHQKD